MKFTVSSRERYLPRTHDNRYFSGIDSQPPFGESHAFHIYRLPSSIFAPYKVPGLDKMAKELDDIFLRIVRQTTN